MNTIIEETVDKDIDTVEKIERAFEKTDYSFEQLQDDDIRVQNGQAPGQMIVRWDVESIKTEDEVEIADNETIYVRLLLNKSDKGVVVLVRDPR